jgi:hypothetical protein
MAAGMLAGSFNANKPVSLGLIWALTGPSRPAAAGNDVPPKGLSLGICDLTKISRDDFEKIVGVFGEPTEATKRQTRRPATL